MTATDIVTSSSQGDTGAVPYERLHRPAPLWLKALAAAGLLALVALRFIARSHLWLDEALSVNIARLPLRQLPDALRHDGAPPLYYVLLHLWMRVFGSSTIAVRVLSGIFGAAALPLMWIAARRTLGRIAATAAVVLLASSPFAIRYATESRMYSLVVVLTLLGYLAVAAALNRPTWRNLAATAAITAALLYTHYWSFELLAMVTVVIALRAWRGPAQAEARKVLGALVVGGLLFVPWLPVFMFQLAHTGTPWAARAMPRAVIDTIFDFGGGHTDYGEILGAGLAVLVVVGIWGHRRPEGLVLFPRPSRIPGELALITFGTLTIAMLLGLTTGAAYAGRYASIVLVPFVLLCAIAITRIGARRTRVMVMAPMVILGLIGGVWSAATERTEAPKVAAAIRAAAAPGDLVVYCPDQLGPAVSRLLPEGEYRQLTFPLGTPPERVDWVDYAVRNHAADPALFGRDLLQSAGAHDIWLVWSPGYRTYGSKCDRLMKTLEAARPMTRVVKVKVRYFEHPGLIRFDAP